MKKTILLLGTLLMLSGCTTAGGFGTADQFYYSRTTSFLGFSWDSIYYCQASGDKSIQPKVDCKKADVSYGPASPKVNTSTRDN